jgi:hypothetical protein
LRTRRVDRLVKQLDQPTDGPGGRLLRLLDGRLRILCIVIATKSSLCVHGTEHGLATTDREPASVDPGHLAGRATRRPTKDAGMAASEV